MAIKPTIKAICLDENINYAIKACKKKKTALGPDNMSINEFEMFWMNHGSYIKKMLIRGEYYPMEAKEICIPKPNKKGVRKIAILMLRLSQPDLILA